MAIGKLSEVPDGVYRVAVHVDGARQLAGYLYAIQNNAIHNQYYVMRKEYLPPVVDVSELIFIYGPAEIPDDFSDLDMFVTKATQLILEQYNDAEIGKVATKEEYTAWPTSTPDV